MGRQNAASSDEDASSVLLSGQSSGEEMTKVAGESPPRVPSPPCLLPGARRRRQAKAQGRTAANRIRFGQGMEDLAVTDGTPPKRFASLSKRSILQSQTTSPLAKREALDHQNTTALRDTHG